MINPITLLVNSEKIRWGMPKSDIILFSVHENCSIPFELYGENEICRYKKCLNGIPLYITPRFNSSGLFAFKALFEEGDRLENHEALLRYISSECGYAVHSQKEIWKDGQLELYPCSLFDMSDAILEIGIHEDRFIRTGYLLLTNKNSLGDVYTDRYVREIGFDPRKKDKR